MVMPERPAPTAITAAPATSCPRAWLPVRCADLLAHLREERPDLLDLAGLALWLTYPAAMVSAPGIVPPSGEEAARIVALLEDLVDQAGTWRHPARVASPHYRDEADVPALLRLVKIERERVTVQGVRRLRLRQVARRLEAIRDRRRDQARRRMT